MDDIDRQLAEKQEQDRRLRAVNGDFQAKLDAVPKRESDLAALARDYTTLQTSYQSLLAKREVIRVLSLPVLALVPLMTSTVERHSAAVMFWRLQS